MNKNTRWDSQHEITLLLILIAYYNQSARGPSWEEVATLMGPEYTASAVSQKFTKQIAKRDIYIKAQAAFGNAGRRVTSARGSDSSTDSSKKRKASEIDGLKEEGREDRE